MLLPYQKERSRDKISLVKNFVTGKTIRHFLPTNFFAWLSENIEFFPYLYTYFLKKHN